MTSHCRKNHYASYGLPSSPSAGHNEWIQKKVSGVDYYTYKQFLDVLSTYHGQKVNRLHPSSQPSDGRGFDTIIYSNKIARLLKKIPTRSSLHVNDKEKPVTKPRRNNRKWWSTKKVAKYLNVHISTVSKYCSEGKMRSIRKANKTNPRLSHWFIDSNWLKEHFKHFRIDSKTKVAVSTDGFIYDDDGDKIKGNTVSWWEMKNPY